jgi:hypothetical protein
MENPFNMDFVWTYRDYYQVCIKRQTINDKFYCSFYYSSRFGNNHMEDFVCSYNSMVQKNIVDKYEIFNN